MYEFLNYHKHASAITLHMNRLFILPMFIHITFKLSSINNYHVTLTLDHTSITIHSILTIMNNTNKHDICQTIPFIKNYFYPSIYLPQPCENGGREEGAAPGIQPPPEHSHTHAKTTVEDPTN